MWKMHSNADGRLTQGRGTPRELPVLTGSAKGSGSVRLVARRWAPNVQRHNTSSLQRPHAAATASPTMPTPPSLSRPTGGAASNRRHVVCDVAGLAVVIGLVIGEGTGSRRIPGQGTMSWWCRSVQGMGTEARGPSVWPSLLLPSP